MGHGAGGLVHRLLALVVLVPGGVRELLPLPAVAVDGAVLDDAQKEGAWRGCLAGKLLRDAAKLIEPLGDELGHRVLKDLVVVVGRTPHEGSLHPANDGGGGGVPAEHELAQGLLEVLAGGLARRDVGKQLVVGEHG
jgi:hypothetical protein